MTPTQAHLLKLVLEIDKLCKENGIEYWLDYGTTLGAVRHKGFIPWDNDLDIGMTEENYDKFKQLCAEKLDGTTRTFVDNRLNRGYPVCFGRYIDLECCRMSRFSMFWDYYCGQVIDVFCYVNLPAEPKACIDMINEYYAYDEYCNRSFRHYEYKTDEIMRLYEGMKEREKEIGREAVMQEFEGRFFGQHHDDANTIMCTSARMSWNTVYPKELFDELIDVEYAGHMLPIPARWHELCIIRYGDKYTFYPPKLRIHSEMSHTEVPCKVYVDAYTNVTDIPAMLAKRETFKEMGMERGLRLGHANQHFCQEKGALALARLERRIADESIDLAALVAENSIESLEKLQDLLGEYIALQFTSTMLYWRCELATTDEIEEAGLYTMLMTKLDTRFVERFLIVRWLNGREPTEAMSEVRAKAIKLRRMHYCVQVGLVDEARELLAWAKAELPAIPDIEIEELRVDAQVAVDEQSRRSVLARADELAQRYPKEDWCRMVAAEMHEALGEDDAAEEIFDALAETTNNGLIISAIAERREASQAEGGER